MKRRLLLIGGLAAMAVFAQEKEEAYDFRFPKYDKDGVMISQVFGDHAVILEDQRVDISNFKIETYDKGRVDMRVTAPKCLFNRKTQAAQSESAVRITREKMIVTGSDFSWDAESEVFTINRNAKVVLMDIRRNMNSGESQ